MKRKIFLVFGLVLILNVSMLASVYIVNEGSYENEDITFVVRYHWGNSTPTPTRPMVTFSSVSFHIESKKGGNIYNRTCFNFGGRSYIFNAGEVTNGFYKEGYREISNTKLNDKSVVELEYEIKNSDGKYFTTRKVRKSFIIHLPEDLSDRNAKIRIVEMAK